MKLILDLELYFENFPSSGKYEPRYGSQAERLQAMSLMREHLEKTSTKSYAIEDAVDNWQGLIPAYILDLMEQESVNNLEEADAIARKKRIHWIAAELSRDPKSKAGREAHKKLSPTDHVEVIVQWGVIDREKAANIVKLVEEQDKALKESPAKDKRKALRGAGFVAFALILMPIIFLTVGHATYFLLIDVFELKRSISNDLTLAFAILATLVAFITIVKRDPSAFKSVIKKVCGLNRSKANPCYMAQPYSVIALGAIWYAVNWMTYKLFLEFDWFYYEDKHWPAIVASAFVFWLYYPVFWGKKSTTLDDNSDSKFH